MIELLSGEASVPSASLVRSTPPLADLDRWQFAVDYRWDQPWNPPLSDEHGVEVVRDTVRALRLHHPGVTGTTIIWTRPDLCASLEARLHGVRLFAPMGLVQVNSCIAWRRRLAPIAERRCTI